MTSSLTLVLTILLVQWQAQQLLTSRLSSSSESQQIERQFKKFQQTSANLLSESANPEAKTNSHNSNRWEDDYPNSVSENDIDANPSRLNEHKSQLDYACGRAVSNKKYKELLLRDQNYQMSLTRQKYRPIEIRMPRIIGGDETAPGEFPWAASVKLNGQPICGGSLIDRKWILTAAHCVVGYNPKNLTVRLGAYRIKDTSELQSIDIAIDMFIVHQQYSMPRPFSNDIALLKLQHPIEYNDFIIPVCLPTEDQVSTSTLNEIVNDYANIKNFSPTPAEDTEGIVVSTKMSDKEITKCFHKLEQNYLNSIGLGNTMSETSSASPVANQLPQKSQQQPPVHQNHHNNHHHHNQQQPQHLAAAMMPSATATANKNNQALAYDSIFEPIQMPSNNINNFKDHSDLLYDTISNNHNDEKITFASQHSANNFHHQTQAEQNFEFAPQQQHNHLTSQGNYVLYGTPLWDKRTSEDKSAVDARTASAPMIKLTSLPINKELLREIQSVGSMPSLNLELHQSDFLAMANDLDKPSAHHAPAATTAAVTDRERIRQNLPSGSGGRQVLRTSMSDAHEGDDPSRYSGLSGVVVGWGWVRENSDNDEQVGTSNKGFPSVTLQKVKLPILRNDDCEAWFQSQAKKITLLPSQFCAGFNSGGKDACRGDSGGPMVIEDNSDTGRYKLIGIVSAGIGCARPSLPGLYTRVASFLPWINAQIARH